MASNDSPQRSVLPIPIAVGKGASSTSNCAVGKGASGRYTLVGKHSTSAPPLTFDTNNFSDARLAGAHSGPMARPECIDRLPPSQLRLGSLASLN